MQERIEKSGSLKRNIPRKDTDEILVDTDDEADDSEFDDEADEEEEEEGNVAKKLFNDSHIITDLFVKEGGSLIPPTPTGEKIKNGTKLPKQFTIDDKGLIISLTEKIEFEWLISSPNKPFVPRDKEMWRQVSRALFGKDVSRMNTKERELRNNLLRVAMTNPSNLATESWGQDPDIYARMAMLWRNRRRARVDPIAIR
jgi:hypothetical protein